MNVWTNVFTASTENEWAVMYRLMCRSWKYTQHHKQQRRPKTFFLSEKKFPSKKQNLLLKIGHFQEICEIKFKILSTIVYSPWSIIFSRLKENCHYFLNTRRSCCLRQARYILTFIEWENLWRWDTWHCAMQSDNYCHSFIIIEHPTSGSHSQFCGWVVVAARWWHVVDRRRAGAVWSRPAWRVSRRRRASSPRPSVASWPPLAS